MKKTLLSALAAAFAISASATVPSFNPNSSKSINITQETPTYSNPACASADNNKFFIGGQFDGSFEFVTSQATYSFDSDYTSAYVLCYDVNLAPYFAFMIDGSAAVTSMTTDENNLYVAGQFAGEITFKSKDASGATGSLKGFQSWGEYSKYKQASFIAKYDLEGNFVEAMSFVPEVLPALANEEMYFTADMISFNINQILAYDGKLYFAATYTGSTKVGDLTIDGSYQLEEGWLYADISNSAVISLDLETLKSATIEMSAESQSPLEVSVSSGDITFYLYARQLYTSFVPTGSGKLTVKNGSFSEEMNINTNETELYVLNTPSKLTKLEKKHSDNVNQHNIISTLLVEGGKIYMVGSADMEIPSAKAGEGAQVTGATDVFVATFNASDLSLVSVVADAVDEGKTEFTNSDETKEEKPNYEIPVGAVTTNDDLFISKMTRDANGGFISVASRLFDGEEYSTPIDAWRKQEIPGGMGIARNNGTNYDMPSFNYSIIVLPSSDATQFTFNNTSFVQDIIPASINEIAADIDNSNAPVEYYNLQGIRISEPAAGTIVIRRQGTDIKKILVK
ncbi:MAG: hypothetical protein HDR97_02005 [Bacteroides sp.]|nr:hypothetical protein [Bacteroides sp.]